MLSEHQLRDRRLQQHLQNRPPVLSPCFLFVFHFKRLFLILSFVGEYFKIVVKLIDLGSKPEFGFILFLLDVHACLNSNC